MGLQVCREAAKRPLAANCQRRCRFEWDAISKRGLVLGSPEGGRIAWMPFKVTEIQETPNPNARKFVLDGVIAEVPTSFLSRDQGKDHPIASQLFDISGVTSVLLLGDFVTVNKEAGAKWPTIIKRVRKILEEK